MPRHRRLGVGEGQLGAVPDHPPPLEVLAGQEARRVDQADDGQVEGVAEPDEPRRLLGRGDVERAGQDAGLVGHHAHRHAAEAGEGGHELAGPARPQLADLAVVAHGSDHVAHVVGRRLAVRDDRAQLRRRAQHRVADRGDWRQLVGVRRAGTREARPPRRRRRRTPRRTVRWIGRASPPRLTPQTDPYACELRHHLRARHVGHRLGAHHDQIGQPEQEGRARDDRARWPRR